MRTNYFSRFVSNSPQIEHTMAIKLQLKVKVERAELSFNSHRWTLLQNWIKFTCDAQSYYDATRFLYYHDFKNLDNPRLTRTFIITVFLYLSICHFLSNMETKVEFFMRNESFNRQYMYRLFRLKKLQGRLDILIVATFCSLFFILSVLHFIFLFFISCFSSRSIVSPFGNWCSKIWRECSSSTVHFEIEAKQTTVNEIVQFLFPKRASTAWTTDYNEFAVWKRRCIYTYAFIC